MSSVGTVNIIMLNIFLSCPLQIQTLCLMTEPRKKEWVLVAFLCLSFNSRSPGELNAWLSLRRAQWRISPSPFACVCGCGLCACACLCSEAKHLHPKPKRHTHKSLSDAHTTRRLLCLEFDAHMPSCTTYQPLAQYRVVLLYPPSLSILEVWDATLLKHWSWQGSVSLQKSFLFLSPPAPRLNCRSAHQGRPARERAVVVGDWERHGQKKHKRSAGTALHNVNMYVHLGWWEAASYYLTLWVFSWEICCQHKWIHKRTITFSYSSSCRTSVPLFQWCNNNSIGHVKTPY